MEVTLSQTIDNIYLRSEGIYYLWPDSQTVTHLWQLSPPETLGPISTNSIRESRQTLSPFSCESLASRDWFLPFLVAALDTQSHCNAATTGMLSDGRCFCDSYGLDSFAQKNGKQ